MDIRERAQYEQTLAGLRRLLQAEKSGHAAALARAEAVERALEVERMRLAACGVIAMSNTAEAAMKARDMCPEYRSATSDDVAAAVDREMALAAEVARLRAEISRAHDYLPIVPGSTLCWDGNSLTPHIVAVADEWAVRERQIEAERAEVARLREALEAIALHVAVGPLMSEQGRQLMMLSDIARAALETPRD